MFDATISRETKMDAMNGKRNIRSSDFLTSNPNQFPPHAHKRQWNTAY